MGLPQDSVEYEVVQKMSGLWPGFLDVFDEESFSLCALILAGAAIVLAVFASRYVTISDAGHRD